MNTGISDIMQTRALKKAEADEKRAEKRAAGIVNKIVIDRNPEGLYTCRYSESGPVPEELRGKFTHRQRILEIANRRNLPVEM